MRRIDTVIVGGGQAGLATSRCLAERGVDHVVLERGRIGERWRSERWDSLHLLTPNWMSRLPGHAYRGPDPDGFLHKDEVVALLAGYARSFAAPVEEGTTVTSVAPDRGGDGWRVTTDRGGWRARNVVIASGCCDRPRVPGMAAALDRRVAQVTPDRYRNPADLPPGDVLVVGASATGVQLADEIARSGRGVTLAVGEHNRLPRRYRGRDVVWWLDRLGVLDRPLDDMPDPRAARREPSLQLVGRPAGEPADLDLAVLAARGVRLAGRLAAAAGRRVRFAGELRATVAAADARMARVLERIDRSIAAHGLDDRFPATPRPEPVRLAGPGPAELDLAARGITTVLWATGYRRVYPWLHAPVLDAEGEIRQRRGRTPLPGLYTVGLQFMIRRRSTFLDGVGRDACEIADEIAGARGAQLATAA
ncbi:MAG TPA: NAD(P)-binding domain-containing protein [Thermoanaerobaculia bacterium]